MNANKFNKNHTAVKRLMSELKELQNENSTDFVVQPLEGNIFEWHFTMRGPSETEFQGGIYHGRITFPAEYPNKPPDIVFLTPNGRFETGQKICLNITSYHKESWNPLWGVRSVMLALISYFPQEAKGIGSIQLPKAAREKMARESVHWRCNTCGSENSLALPEIHVQEQQHCKNSSHEQQPIEHVLDAGAVHTLDAPTPKTPAVNAATIFSQPPKATTEVADINDSPPIVEEDTQQEGASSNNASAQPVVEAPSAAAPATPPAVAVRNAAIVTRAGARIKKPQNVSHDHVLAKFNGAMTVILLIISALLVNKYIIREP